MTKIGFLGDPHAKIQSLPEVEKIIDFSIKSFADCKYFVILGDLFDTHAVVRLEIQAFWQSQIDKILSQWKDSPEKQLIIIEGNHDRPHAAHLQNLSALKTLKGDFVLVSDVYAIPEISMGFVGYHHHEEDFVEAALEAYERGGKQFLVCHQTFNGAVYDNGMYAPDGFDAEKLSQSVVISGHIHTAHSFGKVNYPGTSRWESKSDANKEKGLWIATIQENLSWTSELISTEGVVPKMYEIDWLEGDEQPKLAEGNKYVVRMVGASSWISKNRVKILDKAKITPVYTDTAQNRIQRKKEYVSIESFVEETFTDDSVNKEALIEYLRKL